MSGTRKTVGLAMLVKDEAEVLPLTLARVLPVVDHCTIVDTGSSDDTIDVLAEILDGFSHRIHERRWRGFGPNRTELLELARGHADYHLMLDADHTLHVDGERPQLNADVYMVKINGPLEWRLPLLTRDGHPFEYRGVAHSYLHSDASETRAELTHWLSIDGGGGVTIAKLEGDKELLEQAYADDPDDPRTVFYLAQTYRDLGMTNEAMAFYGLRVEMDGWDQETYCARHQLGVLLGEHVSFEKAVPVLLRAWSERPNRAEALRALANLANSVADKMPVPSDELLFVQPGAYGKRI